jgi:hypothetical protein
MEKDAVGDVVMGEVGDLLTNTATSSSVAAAARLGLLPVDGASDPVHILGGGGGADAAVAAGVGYQQQLSELQASDWIVVEEGSSISSMREVGGDVVRSGQGAGVPVGASFAVGGSRHGVAEGGGGELGGQEQQQQRARQAGRGVASLLRLT